MSKINGVEIIDTYAEAFPMWVGRVLITAISRDWAMIAAKTTTGFGTSLIMCPAEAAIDVELSASDTPNKRPGVSVIIGASSKKKLASQLLARVSQCVLTCPTTAVFNALETSEITFDIGKKISFFGDGYQTEDDINDRHVWVIPTMEGDFIIEENFGGRKGVAGGNFLILGERLETTLKATEEAVKAINAVENVFLPFPGGICRSGSKVGSKYKFLGASTNQKYCPTLKGKVSDSELPEDVNCVYEIVINGVSEETLGEAMKVGIQAAVKVPGIKRITAANYGGTLGPYKIQLHEILGL
ncbi:MAG: formylmethanofuran--tetrahydromethanopterin N-formyltransferase [Candidatus Hodarchaeota archaeon]